MRATNGRAKVFLAIALLGGWGIATSGGAARAAGPVGAYTTKGAHSYVSAPGLYPPPILTDAPHHYFQARALDSTGHVLGTSRTIKLAASPRFAGASVPAQTDVASSSGVVPIRVVCPRGTVTGCVGTVSLRTRKKVNGKIQKLGSARFSIASGKAGKVKLKLDTEGRKLIAGGKITPVATVASRDGRNDSATNSSKITVESQSSVNPPPTSFY